MYYIGKLFEFCIIKVTLGILRIRISFVLIFKDRVLDPICWVILLSSHWLVCILTIYHGRFLFAQSKLVYLLRYARFINWLGWSSLLIHVVLEIMIFDFKLNFFIIDTHEHWALALLISNNVVHFQRDYMWWLYFAGAIPYLVDSIF